MKKLKLKTKIKIAEIIEWIGIFVFLGSLLGTPTVSWLVYVSPIGLAFSYITFRIEREYL